MTRRCAAGLRSSADYFGTTAVSVADDIVGETPEHEVQQ